MKLFFKLSLMLLALMLPATASAYDFEVDGIYYYFTGDNQVGVTFQGYDDELDEPIHSYIGNVTIPETVTYEGITYSVTIIDDVAFYDCSGLTSVTIPNSVTSIGDGAFSGCSGLTSVTIGNSVTSIGDGAFSGCSGLTSVTIPNSVISIGNDAFSYCSGLTSVTIPNSVTSIDYDTFYGCESMASVTIGSSVGYIDDSAFLGCYALDTINFNAINCADFFWPGEGDEGAPFDNLNISTINIGDGVQRIPAYFTMGFSGLTSVTIPNSVTSIGDGAFSGCSGLTSVTIGNSVTSIGDGAFSGCSGLTSVTIPNSVISIGNDAFSYCSGLTSVTIPNSVTYIGEYAFVGCSGLTSLTIPNSVTEIGYAAFSDCSGLTRIIVESGNSKYDSRNNCNAIIETATNTLVNGCMATVIPNSVTYIGEYAFGGCSGLTNLTIPNSVTSIGNEAFYACNGLTNVTIPNSVTEIGKYAFWYCSGLTSVNIGNSVTEIGELAFSGCSGLALITVESGNTIFDSRNNCNAIIKTASNTLIVGCKATVIPNSVTSIGNHAFSGCSGLTSVTIPNSVTSVGECAFNGCSALDTLNFNAVNCANFRISSFANLNISTINIGDDVQSIPAYFAYCFKNLTSITIPNSVTSIGNCAFSGCSGLASVTIPNSVTSIGEYAFQNCSGLTSITIGNSVTSIGYGAFYGTAWYNNQPYGLVYAGKVAYEYKGNMPTGTSIILADGTLAIADYAFGGCSGLTSVTIPNSVISIGNYAFFDCSGLTNVTIPNSVTTIGGAAFHGCSGLTSITIGNSVTSIGYGAFYGTAWYNNQPYGLVYAGKVAYEYKGNMPTGTSIILADGTLAIADYAFGGCSGLTSVTIPNSVTSINRSAFYGCSGLNDVFSFIVDPTTVSMGGSVFYRYPNNYAERTLHVPFGTSAAYQADTKWSQYFGSIVEMGPMVATSIDLDKSTARMENGEKLQLRAELKPIEAIYNEVLWGSSNPSVAMVSNNGLVTAVNAGTATITAMTTDGSNLSASCIVTVYTEMSGDVDGNSLVNISDVTALIDYLLKGDASDIVLSNADCDGNEAVNISDVTALIDFLLIGHWPEPEEPEPTPVITSYTVNGVTFNMVEVEGGTFQMGATPEQGENANDNEKPVHQVTLSGFSIGQTEVTQELWQAVMGTNPSKFNDNVNKPVETISWEDCQTFIARLNELTGQNFRLPTEAEWEFAARGGMKSQGYKYSGSDDLNEIAWYNYNAYAVGSSSPDYGTHAAATKAANELGLYDMTGNVWEWCQDWSGDYSAADQINPTGPETGTNRVIRGGGWTNYPKLLRVAARSSYKPGFIGNFIGFRLAL